MQIKRRKVGNHITKFFYGPEDQFLDVLKKYTIWRDHDYHDLYIWLPDSKVKPYNKFQGHIFLWDKKNNHKTLSFIHITELPNKKMELNVYLSQKEKVDNKKYWQLLESKLEEQGWFKPPLPQKPNTTDNINEWFDYYHACKEAKLNYSLKSLAKDCNNSYDYVRKLHVGCPICNLNNNS